MFIWGGSNANTTGCTHVKLSGNVWDVCEGFVDQMMVRRFEDVHMSCISISSSSFR